MKQQIRKNNNFDSRLRVISRLSSFHRIVELNLTYFHSVIVWKNKIETCIKGSNIAWA